MAIEFTSDQKSAIGYRAVDACVIAGPGSGKTSVLVERYRNLIEQHRFEPHEILAITFTEKAAANMKAKLAELFDGNERRLRDLESAWVSTIHGFCARLLKENAIAAGIDPRFTVLDAREAEDLQFAAVNDALDELVENHRDDALALIEALQNPAFIASDLIKVWDAIRCAGKGIDEVAAMPNPGVDITAAMMAETLRRIVESWPASMTAGQRTYRGELLEWCERLLSSDDQPAEILTNRCNPNLNKSPRAAWDALRQFKEALPYLTAWAVDQKTARFRELICRVLERFDELYNQRKLAIGALDFNDLERRAVKLLQDNPGVRNRIKAQFRQVMLDEFQDINQQQFELIRLVRRDDAFFAVGDINQSIYGFRHARPEIFDEYREGINSSGKHYVELRHNFRSRNPILRCVESLLNSAEGIDPRDLVAGAAFPDKSGPSIEILKIQSNGDDEPAAKEARWIAHRIMSLRGSLQLSEDGETRPAEFGDFAVLCRNGDSMTPILESFDHAGIPYVSGRRQSFLLSREGRDIVALLRIILNPRDSIALATVLRSSLVGLSDESLLRIRLLASSISSGLNRIAHDPALLTPFDPDDARKIERFVTNLKRWRETQPLTPLEPLLVSALSDCGFEWIPGTTVAGNIESFLRLARTKGDRLSLRELLVECESLEKAVNLDSELSDRDQGNVVQVMTAHSAKGLEFPVTIIAAMHKGTQRNSAPITFTPDFGLGIKWRDPNSSKKKDKDIGLDDSWQFRNSEYLKEREKKEANRLLYVAMTRAEEHLILSFWQGKRGVQNWAKLIDTVATSADISVFETTEEPPALRIADVESRFAAEIPIVDSPAVTGQHDNAVNVTSLAVFADCPRKYYLQRYIGWNGGRFSRFDPEEDLPEDDELDLTAAELGSAVHEILSGKTGEYPAEAHHLASIFLTSDLGARAKASPHVEREWDFIIDVDGTLIRGTVDLWFEENAEITLVDYKTDAHVNAEAYTPQLALYALAIERATGKRPVHAFLHFLRSDTIVEAALDHPVTDLLAELRAAQDTLRFDLREGDHCQSCQFYRTLCPAGLSAAPDLQAAQTPSQSAAAS